MSPYSYLVSPAEALKQSKDNEGLITLKFINTDKGYFFCGHMANHNELLVKSGAEKAISAGWLNIIFGETIRLEREGSSTLKLCNAGEKDLEGLSEIFGMKLIYAD